MLWLMWDLWGQETQPWPQMGRYAVLYLLVALQPPGPKCQRCSLGRLGSHEAVWSLIGGKCQTDIRQHRHPITIEEYIHVHMHIHIMVCTCFFNFMFIVFAYEYVYVYAYSQCNMYGMCSTHIHVYV